MGHDCAECGGNLGHYQECSHWKKEKTMPDLEFYTDAELEAELERRKMPPRPRPKQGLAVLQGPGDSEAYNRLLITLEAGMDEAEDGHVVKEFEHRVFELAMELIYGKDVWPWWNRKLG